MLPASAFINIFFILFHLSSWPSETWQSEKNTQPATYHAYDREISRFINLNDPRFYEIQPPPYRISSKFGATTYGWTFPPPTEVIQGLGVTNVRNGEVRSIVRTDWQIFYDAVYRTDEFRRRVTPLPKKKSANRFVILSGCSLTYGQGLNDDQTINYYIARSSDQYFPYNYAVPGTALNTTLALIQKRAFRNQIPEKNGVLFYIYISEHIQRATFKLPSYSWTYNNPEYALNAAGELEREGAASSAHPIRNRLLRLIDALFGANILKGKVFPWVTSADKLLVCRMAKQAQAEFLSQYPRGKFVFYVHPVESEFDPDLETCLKKEAVLYRLGTPLGPGNFHIPGDGHPTAAANIKVAADLLRISDEVLGR